ncbi:MAG: PEP-CTERM sorting domain-containing protein [Bryobacteraceae bacterium]
MRHLPGEEERKMQHAASYVFHGRRFSSALLACLFLLTAMSAFADVTVGLPADPGTGNCFPFGCAYNAEYQQVYTSSQFAAPIAITDLEFYNTQVNTSAPEMNSGTWTISLSTTTADWDTLASTFASNIGSGNTVVFSGNLSQVWAFGDTLTIDLSTPFNYNPANGNLLMDVVASGTSAPGGNIYFDTNSTDSSIGRVYCSGGIACGASGVVNDGYGLVTTFSTGSTTPVPEPASVGLFGLLMAGAGLAYRRRLSR